MKTALTQMPGIENPLVGFNRSPAVVAEVGKAGGPTRTGKPARQLRTVWHDQWEPGSPAPLPLPLLVDAAADITREPIDGCQARLQELANLVTVSGAI